MNIKEMRILLIVIYLLTLVGLFYPFAEPLLQNEGESFLSLTILGNDTVTGSYFDPEESRVFQFLENEWNLRPYNGLNEPAYISIRIKITGSDTDSPNPLTCTPSNAQTIYETNMVLVGDEEVIVPFTWAIGEIEATNDEYILRSLVVNDKEIRTAIFLEDDLKSKIIFEMWIYDLEINEFKFTISDGDEMRCIWNQINLQLDIEE
jgi:hypothetical protein